MEGYAELVDSAAQMMIVLKDAKEMQNPAMNLPLNPIAMLKRVAHGWGQVIVMAQ